MSKQLPENNTTRKFFNSKRKKDTEHTDAAKAPVEPEWWAQAEAIMKKRWETRHSEPLYLYPAPAQVPVPGMHFLEALSQLTKRPIRYIDY